MSSRLTPIAVLTAAAFWTLAAAPTPAAAQQYEEGAEAEQQAPTCTFGGSDEELAGRASPPDSSSVALTGGVLKLCYSSPRKRDREIFGGLVPYDQPWRLGANEPTTLHVTTPVTAGGVELAKGSYAVYAIPGQESWEIVFNGAVDRWGIPIDEDVRAHDIGSVTVTPESTEGTVENMTLTLESTAEGAATLSMAWDDTRWSLSVKPAEGEEEEYSARGGPRGSPRLAGTRRASRISASAERRGPPESRSTRGGRPVEGSSPQRFSSNSVARGRRSFTAR